ncbi:MAG: hypothetical protein WAU58_04860 [Terriglobales bacterium]
MNSIKVVGMLCALAVVVLVAAVPYASATAPANGFYQVDSTVYCNAWYFWTQNSTYTGSDAGWNYASGYQDGCVTGFVEAGFQVAIKKGQPPNDNNGTSGGSNRTSTDVELSDLYWCNFISDCSDMYVTVFDIGAKATAKHPNSMVYYYVDGDTFLYEYDETPITVSYSLDANARPKADASRANLPAAGSFKPVNAGTLGKDGVRVK